jgi:beta-N-acetylhexosaminidase
MVDITASPFHLDADGVEWVHSTLASMDLRTKVGQLFHLALLMPDAQFVDAMFEIAPPNGFMFRGMPAAEVVRYSRYVQGRSTVPALLAANLEKGADGLIAEGTSFGSPLQVAATGDVGFARKFGISTGREARAVGCNWGFSPIVDIQYNHNNPITNIRCFGSFPATVASMSEAMIAGMESQGVAATPKHFPGDGVDDRDQHLVTTVNTLSPEAWRASFGMVYRRCFEAGAKSVMVGHIALPAMSKELRPGIADGDILPATLAPELLTDLLRGELGFNGVICSDALQMVGYTIPMARKDALPHSVAAGIDVLLFAIDYAEDVQAVLDGIASGVLTEARVDEAVTRILALKASLGLHAATSEVLVPGVEAFHALPLAEDRAWARESADTAVTLVKDLEPGVLPLNPTTHKRVLVYYTEDANPNHHKIAAGAQQRNNGHNIADALNAAGFEAKVFERAGRATLEEVFAGTDAVQHKDLLANYDLVLYVAQYEPASSAPTVRLQWSPLIASDAPKHLNEIPTVFVSLGSPFHLQDVPRVKTFINAYGYSPETVQAVAEKLLGRSGFTGVSPVDPFCGYWDARL